MGQFNRELDSLLSDIKKQIKMLKSTQSSGLSNPISQAHEEGANQARAFMIHQLEKLVHNHSP